MATRPDEDLFLLTRTQKWFFGLPLLFGIGCLLLLGLVAHVPGNGWFLFAGWQFVLKATSILLLSGGAAFAGGAILGFVFAVPRMAGELASEPGSSRPRLALATANLVSIADWLSKLLIGIGLIQFTDILRKVRTVSADLALGLGIPQDAKVTPPQAGTIISFSLAYFFVWGFLTGYLLTQEKMPEVIRRSYLRDQELPEREELARAVLQQELDSLKSVASPQPAAGAVGARQTVIPWPPAPRSARGLWWLGLLAALGLLGALAWRRASYTGPAVSSRPGAGYGEQRPLLLAGGLPYTSVQFGAATGQFLLDFGTQNSSYDSTAFAVRVRPQPNRGNPNQFAGFDFFGPWASVVLTGQSLADQHLAVPGGTGRPAGIIGTDFFKYNIFTLDYANRVLYRATAKDFPADAELRARGFGVASSSGYYADNTARLKAGVANTPAVPARLGGVTALAFLTTGFDDNGHRHAIIINEVFFKGLQAAGVGLDPLPGGPVQLKPNPGYASQAVTGYKVRTGAAFELVDPDGKAIVRVTDAVLFLKTTATVPATSPTTPAATTPVATTPVATTPVATPPVVTPPVATIAPGDISALSTPAVQLGASFFLDAGQVIVDPFSSRVWFGHALP